jgi:hypothetical protein
MILHRRVVRYTHLHPHTNILKNLIYDSDDKIGVISSQFVQEHREIVDASEFDLPDLCEGIVQLADNLICFGNVQSCPYF